MLKSHTAACDFDWHQLNQLAGEDADFESELLTIFLQDAENSLHEIRSAIAAKNIPALEEAAHALKGASANVGARAIAATASQLEQIARSGNIQGAHALMQKLTRLCLSVQAQLQTRR